MARRWTVKHALDRVEPRKVFLGKPGEIKDHLIAVCGSDYSNSEWGQRQFAETPGTTDCPKCSAKFFGEILKKTCRDVELRREENPSKKAYSSEKSRWRMYFDGEPYFDIVIEHGWGRSWEVRNHRDVSPEYLLYSQNRRNKFRSKEEAAVFLRQQILTATEDRKILPMAKMEAWDAEREARFAEARRKQDAERQRQREEREREYAAEKARREIERERNRALLRLVVSMISRDPEQSEEAENARRLIDRLLQNAKDVPL